MMAPFWRALNQQWRRGSNVKCIVPLVPPLRVISAASFFAAVFVGLFLHCRVARRSQDRWTLSRLGSGHRTGNISRGDCGAGCSCNHQLWSTATAGSETQRTLFANAISAHRCRSTTRKGESEMTDRSNSAKPLEPDFDRMWLRDEGAEIKVTFTKEKRALDIVKAIRARYAKSEEDSNSRA